MPASTKGISAGTAYVDVVPDVTSFGKDVSKGMNSHAKEIGAAAGKIGLVISGAVALGAKRAVDAASNLNESISAVDTVFGKHAGQIQEWSKNTTDALSRSEFLNAVKIFGMFGKGSGLAGKALNDFSKDLIDTVNDIASFHNADPSEVLANIQSGLSGESEPLRKYGIFMNEAALAAEGLSMGLIKQGEKMTDNEKIMARKSFILKHLGAAEGDWARTMASAANQERIQGANTSDLTAKLGMGLLPAYKALLGIGLKIVSWLGEHTEVVKYLAAGLAILGGALLAVGAGFKVAELAGKAYAAVQWLVNAALSGNPILLVVLALAALVAGFVYAWKNSEKFRDIVHAVMDTVRRVFGELVDFIREHWRAAWDGIKRAFMLVVNFIVDHWKTLLLLLGPLGIMIRLIVAHFDAIKDAAGKVALFIRDNWRPVFEWLLAATKMVIKDVIAFWNTIKPAVMLIISVVRNVMEAVFGQIEKIVLDIVKIIKGVINIVIGLFTGDWARAWNGLKTAAEAGWNLVKDWILYLPTKMLEWTVAIGKALVDGIRKGIEAAWEGLKSYIGDKLDDLVGSIRDKLKIWSPSRVTMEIGHMLARGLGDGFGQGMIKVVDFAAEKVQAVIDRMIEVVRDKKSEMDQAFGAMASTALQAFDKVAGDYLTPTESRLASGDKSAAAKSRQKALVDARKELADARKGATRLSPLEKRLASEDLARAEAERNRRLSDAEQAVRDAEAAYAALKQQEGESQDDFAARQAAAAKNRVGAERNVSEAIFDIKRAADEALLRAEMAQQDKIQARVAQTAAIAAAQASVQTAKDAIARAADEARALQERAKYADKIALQRRHFEEELAELGIQMAKGDIKHTQALERTKEIFQSYNVPFRKAGKVLGSALAEGIRDSISEVGNAAGELHAVIVRQLAKLGISIEGAKDATKEYDLVHKSWRHIQGFAGGGNLNQGQWGLVGEDGPELIKGGQGGNTILPLTGRSLVHVEKMTVRSELDIALVASSLYRKALATA